MDLDAVRESYSCVLITGGGSDTQDVSLPGPGPAMSANRPFRQFNDKFSAV